MLDMLNFRQKSKSVDIMDKDKKYDSKVCDLDFEEQPINIVQYFAGTSLYSINYL